MTQTEITNALVQAIDGFTSTALFRRIYAIHSSAVASNTPIVYPPNKLIALVIPTNAESIPLSEYVDFNNCTFIVQNASKPNFHLFSLVNNNTGRNIAITSANVNRLTEGGNLGTGDNECGLLLLTESELWTKRNEEDESNPLYYDIFRKDILLVYNNIAQNSPIYPYTDATRTIAEYVNVTQTKKIVKNAILIRLNVRADNDNENNEQVTNFIKVEKQYNVLIENITVEREANFQQRDPLHDACFHILNSADITFRNIKIENTYSSTNVYGYGFDMDNVYISRFDNIEAYKTEKGVFGTCNMNKMSISNSILSRVDIHCYGRDVTCFNCKFHNDNEYHRINRFSSLYGTLTYDHCYFDDFLPVRFDSAYSAFTGFDLVMRDCHMVVSNRVRSIYRTQKFMLNTSYDHRLELQDLCLPNFDISNLFIHVIDSQMHFTFMEIDSLAGGQSIVSDVAYMDSFYADLTIKEPVINQLNVTGCSKTVRLRTSTFSNRLNITRLPVVSLTNITPNS